MNTKKYIFLTLYIILCFLIYMLAPPLLSYSHTDYSIYYLVFEVLYGISIPLILIGVVIFGVIDLTNSREKNIRQLLKVTSLMALPVLAIMLTGVVTAVLSQQGLSWHIPYILKLHSTEYKKDIDKFYQENLETVAKETTVLRLRSMPPGFPAYQAQYEMFRAQDSTCNIAVRYCVNPLRRNHHCYLYYSGDTADLKYTFIFDKWVNRRYHLWGNWYYCDAKS